MLSQPRPNPVLLSVENDNYGHPVQRLGAVCFRLLVARFRAPRRTLLRVWRGR